MKILNKQYNEINEAISTLWVNDQGEYFIEKNGIFTQVGENIRPRIIEFNKEQITSLQNQYKKELSCLTDTSMLVETKINPKKVLGDEFINKIR